MILNRGGYWTKLDDTTYPFNVNVGSYVTPIIGNHKNIVYRVKSIGQIIQLVNKETNEEFAVRSLWFLRPVFTQQYEKKVCVIIAGNDENIIRHMQTFIIKAKQKHRLLRKKEIQIDIVSVDSDTNQLNIGINETNRQYDIYILGSLKNAQNSLSQSLVASRKLLYRKANGRFSSLLSAACS